MTSLISRIMERKRVKRTEDLLYEKQRMRGAYRTPSPVPKPKKVKIPMSPLQIEIKAMYQSFVVFGTIGMLQFFGWAVFADMKMTYLASAFLTLAIAALVLFITTFIVWLLLRLRNLNSDQRAWERSNDRY